jgi:hypothetical protein
MSQPIGDTELPLILLPGMAADGTLFRMVNDFVRRRIQQHRRAGFLIGADARDRDDAGSGHR